MIRMIAVVVAGLLISNGASAGNRILATGGVTPIEGGGGGGLSPWALITGYGSSGELGGTAFLTRVDVDDFRLTSRGVALGWHDRIEVSYARQTLKVMPLDTDLKQDVFGFKMRLLGNLLYSSWPQLSVGFQHKRSRTFEIPEALGASEDKGTDIYISAAKLWFAALLDRNVFVNANLRRTRANETGLLGFGAHEADVSLVLESSIGVFLSDRWVVGYEYRQKPNHLSSIEENDWQDAFMAFFPSKHVSIVGAWADLSEIAGLPDQQGWYLSVQASL